MHLDVQHIQTGKLTVNIPFSSFGDRDHLPIDAFMSEPVPIMKALCRTVARQGEQVVPME